MAQVSYAQIGEDLIADYYLRNAILGGRYVDVGAGHPVHYSNTYHFYQHGWCGLCVEPLREFHEEYGLLRPRDMLCGEAAAGENGSRLISVFHPLELSTMVDATRAGYRAKGERFEEVRRVNCATLPNLMARLPGPVDLLSVDVEGMELEVLASNNWQHHRPRLIIIETKRYKSRETQEPEVTAYLTAQGYARCADTGLNTLYCLPELLD